MQESVQAAARERIKVEPHVGIVKPLRAIGRVGCAAEKSETGNRGTVALINGDEHFTVTDFLNEAGNRVELHYREIESYRPKTLTHYPSQLVSRCRRIARPDEKSIAIEDTRVRLQCCKADVCEGHRI